MSTVKTKSCCREISQLHTRWEKLVMLSNEPNWSRVWILLVLPLHLTSRVHEIPVLYQNQGTRPTLSQLSGFEFRRTTFLNNAKFIDLLMPRLSNCKKAGRERKGIHVSSALKTLLTACRTYVRTCVWERVKLIQLLPQIISPNCLSICLPAFLPYLPTAAVVILYARNFPHDLHNFLRGNEQGQQDGPWYFLKKE